MVKEHLLNLLKEHELEYDISNEKTDVITVKKLVNHSLTIIEISGDEFVNIIVPVMFPKFVKIDDEKVLLRFYQAVSEANTELLIGHISAKEYEDDESGKWALVSYTSSFVVPKDNISNVPDFIAYYLFYPQFLLNEYEENKKESLQSIFNQGAPILG